MADFWDLNVGDGGLIDDGGYSGPVVAPTPWDTVTLAGKQVPGVCEVSASPARKVDVKSAPGIGGATITIMGYEPTKIDIKVTVWTPPQWTALQAVLKVVWPGKSPVKAFDIYHPALDVIGVKSAICIGLSPFTNGAFGRQSRTVTIKMLQWGKGKRPAATPTSSVPTRPEFAPDVSAQTASGQLVTSTPANAPQPLPSTSATYTGP